MEPNYIILTQGLKEGIDLVRDKMPTYKVAEDIATSMVKNKEIEVAYIYQLKRKIYLKEFITTEMPPDHAQYTHIEELEEKLDAVIKEMSPELYKLMRAKEQE